MRSEPRRSICMLLIFCLLTASAATPAFAQRGVARTEMSRVFGRCVLAIGAGALIGGLLGGRRDRGRGAVIGAGIGAGICVVLAAHARRQDRLIAAERAAAAAETTDPIIYPLDDGKGTTAQLISTSVPVTPTGTLAPVRFPSENGGEIVSPALGEEPRLCRRVSSELVGDDGRAALPPQLYCRSAESPDWYPYSERSVRS